MIPITLGILKQNSYVLFGLVNFFRIMSMMMPRMAHKLSIIIAIIKKGNIKRHNLSYITVNLNLWVY